MTMTRKMIAMIASAMALTMTFSSLPSITHSDILAIEVTASAQSAGMWDELNVSESNPIFFVAGKKCTTYSDTSLSSPTGEIWKGDNCKIIQFVSENCALVEYPVSKGTRRAYIYVDNLIGSIRAKKTASCRFNVYTDASEGKKYGSAYDGDTLYELDSYLNDSNHSAVIYTISGGWKLGVANDKNLGYSSQSYSASGSSIAEALYNNSSAYISCGFDGYTTTSGRHEGIDCCLSNGSAIYSLTSGTVVRVKTGYCGSSGLSTIAIYDSANDKTVIYLHSNPAVSEGDTVNVGDLIGYQSWCGVSSSSAGHTHVEVRDGYHGWAAKSVGDYNLENVDPSDYWESWGYTT